MTAEGSKLSSDFSSVSVDLLTEVFVVEDFSFVSVDNEFYIIIVYILHIYIHA